MLSRCVNLLQRRTIVTQMHPNAVGGSSYSASPVVVALWRVRKLIAMKSARGLLINDGDIVSEKLRGVRIQRRGWRTASVAVSSPWEIASSVDTIIAWSYVRYIKFAWLSNEYHPTEYHGNIYIIIMRGIKCNVRKFHSFS